MRLHPPQKDTRSDALVWFLTTEGGRWRYYGRIERFPRNTRDEMLVKIGNLMAILDRKTSRLRGCIDAPQT